MSGSNTYDEFYSGGTLRKRWDWGSTPRTYYEYDEDGNVTLTREFNADENAAADAREASEQAADMRKTLMQQLVLGVEDIQHAVTDTGFDAQTAITFKNSADSVKAEATAQRTAIAGFTASPTYSAAQITAIKNQLDQLAARDQVFAQAFADSFAWRRDVDTSMVKVYNALLWLARVVSGRLAD